MDIGTAFVGIVLIAFVNVLAGVLLGMIIANKLLEDGADVKIIGNNIVIPRKMLGEMCRMLPLEVFFEDRAQAKMTEAQSLFLSSDDDEEEVGDSEAYQLSASWATLGKFAREFSQSQDLALSDNT